MTLLPRRDRARVWSRARPRSWMWAGRRHNIDHASHSSKAVQSAEVRVSACLRKRVLVNEPCVRKNSSVTVRVIRRTELPISCARRAAGDTVVIAAPGPPHGVTHEDVECVRHKPYFVSCRPHRHIENLAASQSSTASHLTSVLIDNPDDWNSALFSCGVSVAVVVGFSCGQECHSKQHCYPTSPRCSSL